MEEKLNAPVFICGHRKTGSTMFAGLFDGHPELLVFPIDLTILYAYYPRFITNEFDNNQRKERLDVVIFKNLENLFKENSIVLPFNIDEFRNLYFSLIEDENLTDMKVLIQSLVSAFNEVVKGKGLIPVIKETSIEIYADEIYSWFPDAKMIQLIRDPRDNYAALKAGVGTHYSNLGENEKETLASMIHRAKLGMEIGLINQETYGESKYIILRFEDVIQDLKGQMDKVAEFLNIKPHNSLLEPTKLGNKTIGNNYDGDKFTSVTNKNVGRWEERISEVEAQIIEFHLNDLMKRFDYDINYSKQEQVLAASEFYKWQNYRYFYNDRFV